MNRFFMFIALVVAIAVSSCAYDDTEVWDTLNDHEDRISKLEELCAKMNTNISSLQTIVNALQNNDYVTSVTPVTKDGETIGYTITFTKSQPITIYHGEDGKDGQNGTDGKDGVDGKDGSMPVIGVKQDSDNIYYWTLNGEWLLDANGNKIKAQGTDGKNGQDGATGTDGKDGVNGADGKDGKDGEDGKDGANGTDGKDGEDGKDGVNGADGKDGITPQLKIENDYWYISYDNGASWTQLGKATGENGKDGQNGTNGINGVDGANGADGKDGDSFFRSVTQDEKNVYFTLADGTVITLPKSLALSISFDEADLVVMSPNSTRQIGYTVTSATESVKVEVTSSADIKAKVVADNENGLTGKIHIATGATIDEYSKVIVFVSNNEKVIMRSITFEEAGLIVEENAKKFAAAEGGEITLEFLSNMECEAVIPEDAQSWISVVPATRAMEKQTITLKLEPNEGYYRSATVIVQSPDGTLKLEYQVEQEGELGVEIDPTQIPDNEIWYVSTNNEPISLTSVLGFGAKIISHTHNEGLNIIKFDGAVLNIPEFLFVVDKGSQYLKQIYLPTSLKSISQTAFYNCSSLIELHIPNKVESVGDQAIMNCYALKTVTIPSSVKNIGSGLLNCCSSLESIQGDNSYISEDKRMIIIDGVLNSIAPAGLTKFTIPSNVSIVGYGVFCDINSLETIDIPNSVIEIQNLAFDFCSGLKEVNIPNSVKSIGQWAFRGTKATSIHIPESVESIGNAAFNECPNLKSFSGKFATDDGIMLIINGEIVSALKNGIVNLSIPSNVKHIGGQMFCDVQSLETVTISEGVEIIDIQAFAYNPNLKTINIPNSVTSLGAGIVHGCPKLEHITGKYTSEDGRCIITDGILNSFAPANLTEYTLPKDVTIIGSMAFSDNFLELKTVHLPEGLVTIADRAFRYSGLETITLPSTLKYLYAEAFYGSNALKTIYCKSLFPPAFVGCDDRWETVFGHIHPDAVIYVPEKQVEQYKREWPWYSSIIKGYDFGNDNPDHYITTDYSKDGSIVSLQTATKGEGIDIVLMGDAYSDRQIADGTYEADMENLYNNLFTEEPYKSFKDHFNVHYVNVVSATEGYVYGNTALDGYFGDGTLVGGNDNAVFNYALKAISEEKMDEALLIVAMNSDNYAGTCYMYYPTYAAGSYGSGVSVAYFPKGGDAETFAQLLHHEACGHGFAKLADEYAYEGMGAVPSYYASDIQMQQDDWGWWKNVDFTSDPYSIRWSHFINDSRYANEGLGAYEGGLTYWSGVWRPTENSIMRYNTGGFNAPSREAIYYRIHKLAYGDSWQYDYEEFVEWDARNRKSEALAARKAVKPANYKPTHAPIIVNKSWRDAK